jgi:hypothetical protein
MQYGSQQYHRQAGQKIIPIHVIKENVAALNSPHNDVLKGSGRVYSCFSWHSFRYYDFCVFSTELSMDAPNHPKQTSYIVLIVNNVKNIGGGRNMAINISIPIPNCSHTCNFM